MTKKRTLLLALLATVMAFACFMFAACGAEKFKVEWDVEQGLTVSVTGQQELPSEWEKDTDLVFTVSGVKTGWRAVVKNGTTSVSAANDGNYSVKITKETKISVTSERVLNDLVVEYNGTSVLFEGQTIDKSVLKVTAKYGDGDEKVEDFTITYKNGQTLTTGDTVFTVSFGGKVKDVTIDAVRGAQDFSDAELIIDDNVVTLQVKGVYNVEGKTPEQAKEAVEKWFNDCQERNTWTKMTYTAEVTMEADNHFTLKLKVEGMTDGHQYYFHYGDGADGKNFVSTLKEGWVGVEGQKDHGAPPIIPEGATSIEHAGARYYLGYIPDWGDPVLIIYCENPNAAKMVNVGLEVIENKPYAVFNGTCGANMENDVAVEAILGLIIHLDMEDIKNSNAKLADYVDGSALVMYGEDGTVVTEGGTAKASIKYNATEGTFKVYCLLEGTAVQDGSAFFAHLGAQGSDNYYPNVSLPGAEGATSITCNGVTFSFATATELELTADWQANLLYIKVSAPAAE